MSHSTPIEVLPRESGNGAAAGSLELSVELLPEGAVLFNPDGTIVGANRRVMEQFEADTAEQLIGKSIYTFGRISEQEGREIVAELLGGKSIRFELDFVTLKGAERRFEIVDIPLLDSSGAVQRILGIARDVTEVRRAERERALLAALVKSSDDGIVSIGPGGEVTSWNSGAEKLFGFTAAEAIGRSIVDLYVAPELREHALALIREDFEACREDPLTVRRLQVPARKKDGTVVEVSIAVSGIYDNAGNLLGASNIIRDVTEQRRAEREQARLAALVESTDDAVTSISMDGRIMSLNRSAEKLFGLTQSEAIGKPFEITVPPQYREFAKRSIAQDLALLPAQTDVVRRLEVSIPKKDGTVAQVLLIASGIYDHAGQPLGMSQIYHDISGLKRAEREQALLAAIVSSTDDAVVSLSPDGLITSWNRGAEAILGFSASEAVGQPVTIYLPPQAHAFAIQRIQEQFEKARRHEPIEKVDVPLQRKDQTLLDGSVVASGIYDSSGALIGLSGIIRDVTERNRSERRLAAMASIVNASEDPILAFDKELKIVVWNPAAERTYGCTREDALGHGLELFVPPQNLEYELEVQRRVLKTGDSASYESHQAASNGDPRVFMVNVFPIRDLARNIVGVGGIGRNISKLKEIEKELREAQEYTRGLIESSIDAMVVVDREMRITDGNEQLARLTELPKNRLVGSRFDAYFKDPKRAAAAIQQTLSDGFVTNYDLVLCSASGKEVMVSFNASIFYRAGCVFGIFGVARNVTDQRAIERKLEEERQYSRSLIECSADALLISDQNFVITDLNRRAVELSGYDRGELIGAPLAVLFTDPKRATESVRAALENAAREVELSFLTRAARAIPVAMTASAYRDAEGATRGLLVDLRDITEHQRYESGRALLAAIVDSSGDAIYSESADLTVTSWNTAAERLFGYSASEIVGRSAAVLVPLDRREEIAGQLEAIGKSGKSAHYETRRLRKDGSIIEVDVTASPIFDESGKITGFSLTAHDISERKRMQAEVIAARDEALEAARLKSEFLANMSHEIRTPLNSIIGMTGLLLEGQLSPQQREFAHDVRDSGESLLNLISDILDFSKVTAGKVVFENLDFELTGAVEGAIELVAESARRKKLELTVSIDTECPQYLRGDPSRLRQVLLNLLSNAIKFTSKGEVALQVSKLSENPKETVLRFEVRDSGIGIPAEKQHLLFRPFTQLDASTTRHFGGTGLGLSIARELVQRMGGTIAVTSAPGAGSTFWFTAALAKQVDTAQRASERFASLAGARALIVDDNANNREILRRTLVRWGMQAETADSAAAALELLREHSARFRVALIDVMMPEIDGIELARRIKADPAFGDPSIIFLSSAGSSADVAPSMRGLTPGGWLMKPVPESVLFKALARVLAPEREQTPAAEPGAPPRRPLTFAAAGRKLKALLAEDNPVNQKLAKLQLGRLGFEVDAVSNGREAVEALSRVSYDVVLMDCQMPEMDGYEATRHIRHLEGSARHTRIVAITAHALPGDRDKCLAAGMDAYVSKPVEMNVLEQVLGEVLAEPAAPADGGASPPVRADTPAPDAAPKPQAHDGGAGNG